MPMIPTGALIPQNALVTSPTLGAVLGPLGACLLVAVIVAFAVVVGAMIRGRRVPGVAAYVVPSRRETPPSSEARRRPAA
jgi:hypothetical protein